MTPDEYVRDAMRTVCDQQIARERMHHPAAEDPTTAVRVNHACIGITKEGGELLSLLEKWIYYGQTIHKDRFKDELGDVMWYVALACSALGLSLEEVMEANVRKLKVRYPEKFGEVQAAYRNREAELRAMSSRLQAEAAKGTHPAEVVSAAVTKECDQCHGRGWVSCDWSTEQSLCPVCQGLGHVTVKAPQNQPGAGPL